MYCEYIAWTTATASGSVYGYVRFKGKRSIDGVERLFVGATVEDATHNSSAVIATVKMCSPFEERGRIVLACPKPCRWTDAVTAAKEVVGMTSLLIFISSITTTCIGFIEMRHVEAVFPVCGICPLCIRG